MISAPSLTNLRARWIASFTSRVPSSVNESSFRFTMPITKGRRGNTICLCLARRIIGREPYAKTRGKREPHAKTPRRKGKKRREIATKEGKDRKKNRKDCVTFCSAC